MRLLTYKTAAAVLDCSPSKVQKMCLAGELPILKVGNETRIDERDLQAWIEGRKFITGPKPVREICGDPKRSKPSPTKETENAKH